jgi:enoyl-CoA hydratase
MNNNENILYKTKGKIAEIILNRPNNYNALDPNMPSLLQSLIEKANNDDNVKVILLTGNGKAFCSGYDLKIFAESKRPCIGSQSMPWDPMIDYQFMNKCTENFMSIWRSMKPVICKIKGFAVGGGSDIALCCDQIFMTNESKIGYPPARLWGIPTTFMWVYRLGLEKAKSILFKGELVNGKKAKEIGLVTDSFETEEELDLYVDNYLKELSSIPSNQLAMIKLTINQIYENMGLKTTQILATVLDGVARHTPEGCAFKSRCEEVGFKQAVKERDTNPDIIFEKIGINVPKPKF